MSNNNSQEGSATETTTITEVTEVKEAKNTGAAEENGSAEDKRFTQAELDEIINRRFAREAEKLDKAHAEIHGLQKAVGDTEGLTKKVDSLSKKLDEETVGRTEAELSALRYQVALENGLTTDDLIFLNGSTDEDLRKQAERLVSRVGSEGVVKPKAYGTPDTNNKSIFAGNIFAD